MIKNRNYINGIRKIYNNNLYEDNYYCNDNMFSLVNYIFGDNETMKIIGKIKIKNGKIVYIDNFIEQIAELKKVDGIENREGEIIIDFKEKDVRWYQHKYYRGYVLPPIAEKAFNGRLRRAHLEMKRQFLYVPICDLDDIPEKHMDKCIIDSTITKDENGNKTTTINGYLPSMGSITHKEAAEFILKCEAFLFEFLEGAIEREGVAYRDGALMIKRNENETMSPMFEDTINFNV
jgi:hypothetical protein